MATAPTTLPRRLILDAISEAGRPSTVRDLLPLLPPELQSSASAILCKMARGGLVSRHKAPTDRSPRPVWHYTLPEVRDNVPRAPETAALLMELRALRERCEATDATVAATADTLRVMARALADVAESVEHLRSELG